MSENKEIPNIDGYVTFYLGNKKIFADLEEGGIQKEPNDSYFFTEEQVKDCKVWAIFNKRSTCEGKI